MTLQTQKVCEGCGLKQPSYGLVSKGKARWCAGCAKGHAGDESRRVVPAKGSWRKKYVDGDDM